MKSFKKAIGLLLAVCTILSLVAPENTYAATSATVGNPQTNITKYIVKKTLYEDYWFSTNIITGAYGRNKITYEEGLTYWTTPVRLSSGMLHTCGESKDVKVSLTSANSVAWTLTASGKVSYKDIVEVGLQKSYSQTATESVTEETYVPTSWATGYYYLGDTVKVKDVRTTRARVYYNKNGKITAASVTSDIQAAQIIAPAVTRHAWYRG